MTMREAFILVAGLDLTKQERASAPRHALVVFNDDGDVAQVYRYPWPPRKAEIQEVLKVHPGCLYLVMDAGSCLLESTLRRAIRRQLRHANSPTVSRH